MKTIYKFIFLIALLSACSVRGQMQTPAPLPAPAIHLSYLTTEPPSSIESASTEAPTSEPLPTTYTLDVLFDMAMKQLSVTENISYLNLTSLPLTEIPLVIPPNHEEGQFVLHSLNVATDGSASYTIQEEQLLLTLSNDLGPEDTLSMEIIYTLNLPETNSFFGYTDRQVNVCNWYAFIPPYQTDGGWIINSYNPIGEYLVYDMADFEINITLTDPDPLLVIAASAPENVVGESRFYHLKQARTFVWSASHEFQVLTQAENATVIAYVLPEHVTTGWSALAASISAMNLYSALFGAYPHETLALVEANFYDGMEYDGLFFLGIDNFQNFDGSEKNYLTAIAAHETAHQWWFAAVGNDAANEPWLDESLATYSELLFYETYYPGNETWWWNFRVAHFTPSGYVDSSVYEYTEFRPYINAVYLRGAQFIDELRHNMGDKAFNAFLKDYYQTGYGKIMTRQNFLTVLARHTNIDINVLSNKYFRP